MSSSDEEATKPSQSPAPAPDQESRRKQQESETARKRFMESVNDFVEKFAPPSDENFSAFVEYLIRNAHGVTDYRLRQPLNEEDVLGTAARDAQIAKQARNYFVSLKARRREFTESLEVNKNKIREILQKNSDLVDKTQGQQREEALRSMKRTQRGVEYLDRDLREHGRDIFEQAPGLFEEVYRINRRMFEVARAQSELPTKEKDEKKRNALYDEYAKEIAKLRSRLFRYLDVQQTVLNSTLLFLEKINSLTNGQDDYLAKQKDYADRGVPAYPDENVRYTPYAGPVTRLQQRQAVSFSFFFALAAKFILALIGFGVGGFLLSRLDDTIEPGPVVERLAAVWSASTMLSQGTPGSELVRHIIKGLAHKQRKEFGWDIIHVTFMLQNHTKNLQSALSVENRVPPQALLALRVFKTILRPRMTPELSSSMDNLMNMDPRRMLQVSGELIIVATQKPPGEWNQHLDRVYALLRGGMDRSQLAELLTFVRMKVLHVFLMYLAIDVKARDGDADGNLAKKVRDDVEKGKKPSALSDWDNGELFNLQLDFVSVLSRDGSIFRDSASYFNSVQGSGVLNDLMKQLVSGEGAPVEE